MAYRIFEALFFLGTAVFVSLVVRFFYEENFRDERNNNRNRGASLFKMILIFLGVTIMVGGNILFLLYFAYTGNWLPLVLWLPYYYFDRNSFFVEPYWMKDYPLA